jgi:peptide/nickel transport system permease protein
MRIDRRLLLPGVIVLAIGAMALLAPFLPLADPVRMQVAGRLKPPSALFPLGQDEFGRDVLSRIVWGARTSLTVAVVAATIAALVGTLLGMLGGFWRGVVELFTVRLSEAVLCFPPFLLALLIVTLMGPGVVTLIVALAVLYAPGFTRLAYAETLAVRALDYVTAQEAIGARPLRILGVTLLPNIAPPLLVQFSLTIASALLLESGLSFLGLGVVPPQPSWGSMIRGARSTMEQAPLLLLWPCLALTGTILAFNLLCSRLRDVLDPKTTAAAVGRSRHPSPSPELGPTTGSGSAVLAVSNLSIAIGGAAGDAMAVRNVDLRVGAGETVALVGESGSGKTLTALAVMGLLPPGITIRDGALQFRDRNGSIRDLSRLGGDAMRSLRGDQIAMIFQDAGASLNPTHRIGAQIAEGIRAHAPVPRATAADRAVELLRNVGLPDPEIRARAYPHEISGGQRQRAMIAGAIANAPRLLIADEPTTALDVTIQAQILDLIGSLRRQNAEMGLIFVTHNLAIVAEIADRIAVMYAGEIVEEGPVADVFARPRHPYTAALLASMPEAAGAGDRLAAIAGTVPQPHALPAGCSFAPRCAMKTAVCETSRPALHRLSAMRATRCLRFEALP